MLGTELNYHECIMNEYESRSELVDKTFRLFNKFLKFISLKSLAKKNEPTLQQPFSHSKKKKKRI